MIFQLGCTCPEALAREWHAWGGGSMLAQCDPEGAWTVDQPSWKRWKHTAAASTQNLVSAPCPPHSINFFTTLLVPQEPMFAVLFSAMKLSSQTAPGIFSGLDTQLILVVCRFCIFSFTYLLKFICNPKSILVALSQTYA